MSMELTSKNFEEIVKESKVPVLVDFWASWCGPCRMMGPVVDEISKEVGETAIVTKLNVDDENSLAAKYNVMTIPTFIIFKDGEEKKRFVGVQDKDLLINELKK